MSVIPPDIQQLRIIYKLIAMVPMKEINWLYANGTLNYYISNYEHAAALIRHMDDAARRGM